MDNNISRLLKLSLWLAVVSGYLSLAAVQQYGMPPLFVPLMLWLVSLIGPLLQKNIPWYGSATQLLIPIYVLFLPLSVRMLGLMDAVIWLVVFIQFFSLLHRIEVRSGYHLLLMSFFLLLAGCVQDPGPLFGLAICLFLFAAVWALLMLRLTLDADQARFHNAVVLPLGGHLQQAAPQPRGVLDFGLAGAVIALTLVAMSITFVFFVFTPRMEAGLIGGRMKRLASTGLDNTVQLTGGAYVQQDNTAVMHVEFPDRDPGQIPTDHNLYWRVTTLSDFDGQNWRAQTSWEHHEGDLPPLPGRQIFSFVHTGRQTIERQKRPEFNTIHQRIYLDKAPDQGLPCLDLVYKALIVQASEAQAGLAWGVTMDFTILLNADGRRNLVYDAWSEEKSWSPEELRRAGLDYSYLSAREYEKLTQHNLFPETVQVAQQLTEEATTVYDAAKKVEAFFSGSQFEYTLNVPPLPENHPMDAFINTVRKGHCERYASAAALMLRGLGIPARVVMGYRGGEWHEAEQAVIVRANMAHLWVEVLIPNKGWVIIDPSPQGYELESGNLNQMVASFSRYSLSAKRFWYERIVGFQNTWDWQTIWDLLRALRGWGVTALRTPRTGLVVLGLGVVIWVWRRRKNAQTAKTTEQTIRLKRGRLTKDQRRAVSLYKKLLKGLRTHGMDAQVLRFDEVAAIRDQLAPDHKRILDLTMNAYNRSRFGQRKLGLQRYRVLRHALRNL